jgi:hypothetical protein
LQAEVTQLKAQITDLMQRGSHSSTDSTAVIQLAPSGIPRSCADLKNRGHSLNGVYSIVCAKSVETVHCDFCNLTGDPGKSISFDKLILMVKTLTICCIIPRFSKMDRVC